MVKKSHRSLNKTILAAIGIMTCACSALLLAFVFRDLQSKAMVPIAFLAIVILVSIRCGIASGVLGSAAAALIFATFLYAPLGSPQIANKTARSNTAWLVLGGLTISYLLGSSSGGQQRHN